MRPPLGAHISLLTSQPPLESPVGDKVSKVTRQAGPRGYTYARKKEGGGRGIQRASKKDKAEMRGTSREATGISRK